MIPSDLAARLRMLTEASFFDSEPPVQGTAKVREIQARLPQLVPGQQFNATLMRALPDGTFQAIVAGRNYTLALNHPAQAGDKLDLVVTRSAGNTVFAQLAPPQSGAAAADTARANLSPTGRLISFLLTGQPAPSPAQLAEGRPLLQSPPAAGVSMALAPLLKQALSQSGLFYEAHQLQWLAGKRDTTSLRQEPQGKETPATRQTGTVVQGQANAASGSAGTPPSGSPPPGRTGVPGAQETLPAGGKPAPGGVQATAPAAGRMFTPLLQPVPPAPDGRHNPSARPAGAPPGIANAGSEGTAPSLRTSQEQAAKYVEIARGTVSGPATAGAGRTPAGEGARMPPPAPGLLAEPSAFRANPGSGLPGGSASPMAPGAAPSPPLPSTGQGAPTSAGGATPASATGPNPTAASTSASALAQEGTSTAEAGTRTGASAQEASPSAAQRTPVVPERLVPVVHQQLDAMATQHYVWHGQAWPGQAMEWEIEDPEREGGEPGSEPSDTWNTTLRLILPRLGGVEARLQLTPAGLALRVLADDPDTVAALDAARDRLDSALTAADVPLTGFLAEQRHEP